MTLQSYIFIHKLIKISFIRVVLNFHHILKNFKIRTQSDEENFEA